MTTSDLQAVYSLAGMNKSASRLLENAKYEDVTFEQLQIGPGFPPAAPVRLKNCVFSNCLVRGDFRIGPGVILEQVVFNAVSSPDSLVISANAVLNGVVVKGTPKAGGLWIKPDDFAEPSIYERYRNWAQPLAESVETMLDISEYQATDMEVIGLPLAKVHWSQQAHTPVLLEWKDSETWKNLNLPVTSFWRMRVKRLQSYGAREGVFALPPPGDKKYAQTMEELRQLIEVGLLKGAAPV